MLFKSLIKISLTLTTIILTASTNASLIKNGSFEQLVFTDNTQSIGQVFSTNLSAFEYRNATWDVYSTLPGWTTSFGNGIELQKNVVTQAQEGSHHIELDSHKRGTSNSVMTQSIHSLELGAEYQLSFYYMPRTNSQSDNGIGVYWYDDVLDFTNAMQPIYIADDTKKQQQHWALKSTTFTAQSSSMNLSFGALGRQNTLGGLVDNVTLERVNEVPEPSTLIIALFGIGLMIQRKKHLFKTNKK